MFVLVRLRIPLTGPPKCNQGMDFPSSFPSIVEEVENTVGFSDRVRLYYPGNSRMATWVFVVGCASSINFRQPTEV
jgi:hypothetical protein